MVQKAETAYEKGEYYTALSLYEQIVDAEKSRMAKYQYYYSIAECYRNLNNSRRAESYYRRASRRSKEESLQLKYGHMLLQNGKVSDALAAFQEYKENHSTDPEVENAIKSCSLAVEWVDNPTRYIVDDVREMSEFRDNDFSPAYASGDFSTIYFTSSRSREDDKEEINPVSGMNYTDIYEIRKDRRGRWTDPVIIEDTTVLSDFDDGTPAFNAAKTEMYFTRCTQEADKKVGCQIYKTELQGGGWNNLTRLDFVSDSVSVGHPSISADGLTLYFAAQMSGGVGGIDIWKVTRESETSSWSRPVNLGHNINSPGDEMFPSIREDGVLFFSSNFHPGMGGLDIFRAVKNDVGQWEIYNMKYPVNSHKDDFGIIFQGSTEKGLFSSNRKGARGNDNIYSFELPELKIKVVGQLLDSDTQKPIEEGDVTLVGSDGSVQTIKSRVDGEYSFDLEQYVDYIVVGSVEGYLKNKVQVSTVNVSDNTTFEKDVELMTMSKPIEIPNIFYESGEWRLNDESKEALRMLSKLLSDNPNITIEIGAHTDMIGDEEANMELSRKRAQAIIDYLEEHDYDPDRFEARGYGESKPMTITQKIAQKDTAFVEGQVLTQEFIKTLPPETQKIANQINRRTEIQILSTNYIPNLEYFLRHKNTVSTSD
ncbi:MAG: OmpA family protein [Bacteroidales bacterium]